MWLEGFLERFVRVYLLISKRKGRCWESSSLLPWYYFNREQLFTHFCYRWSLLYFSIAQTGILICYWVFIWNLFKCLKLELTSFLFYSTTFVLFLLFSSSRESLQLEYILDRRNILNHWIITATLHNVANISPIYNVFFDSAYAPPYPQRVWTSALYVRFSCLLTISSICYEILRSSQHPSTTSLMKSNTQQSTTFGCHVSKSITPQPMLKAAVRFAQL